MKILYVTYDDLSRNAAWTVHVAAIANRLVERGHEVHVLGLEGGVSPEIRAEYWPVTRPRGLFLKLLWFFLGAFLELLYYAIKLRPDLIYVRGIHMTPVPGLVSLILRRPVVFEVNGLLEFETRSLLRRRLIRWSHKLSLWVARGVVTGAPLLKEGLCRYYSAREDKITVVANGADLGRFSARSPSEARRELALPEAAAIAIWVGSFYRHHGVDLLLECAASVMEAVPRTVFLLVGDGPERRSLEKAARDRWMDAAVVFAGEVPHDRVPTYLAAADVCLYLFRNEYDPLYGFAPMKLCEYMAAGRPVVAASNMVENLAWVNESGIGLAGALDAASLSRDIIRMLQDPDLRRRCGERGRALAESKYNWDRACAEVERVLEEAVRG